MNVSRSSAGRHRLLVVCMGNICRSPVAGAMLARGLDGVIEASRLEVRTRGTESFCEGNPADRAAAREAARRGHDVSHHRSRCATRDDIEWADAILVMDRHNLRRLRDLFGDDLDDSKVALLGTYAGEEEIGDPFGGDEQTFRHCVDLIERSVDGFLRALAGLSDSTPGVPEARP